MLVKIAVFIFGSIVGSFLNVCIWRLPREESIIKPPSHCPECGKNIPWYDNIPFLSYLLLKGRCRFCKKKISFSYFLVEFFAGLLFLITYLIYNSTPLFYIYILLFSSFIVITFIDLKHQIIPDEITYAGIVLGFILSLIYPPLQGEKTIKEAALNSFLGILTGGGSIYLIGVIGEFIFKKEAMGGGDVKFLAMVGAFIGWKLTLLTFFVSPVFGVIAGLTAKIKYKTDIIPYGPYLALGTIVSIFWGNRILELVFGF